MTSSTGQTLLIRALRTELKAKDARIRELEAALQRVPDYDLGRNFNDLAAYAHAALVLHPKGDA